MTAPAPIHDPIPAANVVAERVKATMSVPVSVAVVLGSGIKALEDLVEGGSIKYSELPGMPEATVAGHAGVLSWGRLGPDGGIRDERLGAFQRHRLPSLSSR